MRKPATIERLYLDFDSFFASVEEQARPALRGLPIGVTPFDKANHTCVIAANKLAKKHGVKTGMAVRDAQQKCPNIQLVPQSPDLYERAHRRLLLAIERVLPIDMVCSIDELTCRLSPQDITDPEGLSFRIKKELKNQLGSYITCSIGLAPNRQLAKIASDMGKPDGLTIFRPEDLPGRLFDLALDDIPGIGRRMKNRLLDAGIWSVEALWNTEPKQLRALWGNVTGERFWYSLHGYDVQAEMTERAMFGHGRVLPPEWRNFDHAFDAARLLTMKAARRLRRHEFLADTFGLWLKLYEDRWSGAHYIGGANDDRSGVRALTALWQQARSEVPPSLRILSLHIAFYDLSRVHARQYDIFDSEAETKSRWSSLSNTMDQMNGRYAKTIVSMGLWTPPPGGYAGGKIAFSRVPDMEDFW